MKEQIGTITSGEWPNEWSDLKIAQVRELYGKDGADDMTVRMRFDESVEKFMVTEFGSREAATQYYSGLNEWQEAALADQERHTR